VWYIQNGMSNRPIVGYKFESCPKEIGLQYSMNIPTQSVGLGISNSGNTDASLILHFYGENITITNETKKTYNIINKTEVIAYFTSSKNSQYYYFEEKVYFNVDKDVDSFSYGYNVIKNSDSTISGSINQLFGEIKGYYPAQCKYQRKTNSQFILIE